MTAFDSEHIFPESKYYDLVIPPKRLLCWGFDSRSASEAHGSSYYEEIFKALLIGLNELAGSKNKRVRESNFSIWGGEYLDGFWVGVPSTINAETAGILRHQFEQVTGYDTQDFGDMASLPFILFFKYNRGLVIEYSCDSLTGRECKDAYGSGVRVQYRLNW